jgi:hypothetical protein
MALTLVLLTAFAAIIGTLTAASVAANANSTTLNTATAETAVTTLATETGSTTSDTSTATTTDASSNATELPFWGMEGMMMGESGFGGGRGFGRGPEGMGNIEVNSEYTATVNTILEGDTDVQNLIAEGYNVTSIRPIIKSLIEADGTLTTKATTAIVTLQNGTSGYAVASVDISQAKVTQIVIFTRTVIDKTAG